MPTMQTSPTRDALALALSHALDRASRYQLKRDIDCAKRLNEMLVQKGEFEGEHDATTLCEYIDVVIDG